MYNKSTKEALSGSNVQQQSSCYFIFLFFSLSFFLFLLFFHTVLSKRRPCSPRSPRSPLGNPTPASGESKTGPIRRFLPFAIIFLLFFCKRTGNKVTSVWHRSSQRSERHCGKKRAWQRDGGHSGTSPGPQHQVSHAAFSNAHAYS